MRDADAKALELHLAEHFKKVKWDRTPTSHLGYTIDRTGGSVRVHQQKYIEALLERYTKAHERHPRKAATPAAPGNAMTARDDDDAPLGCEETGQFLEQLGALMYVAVHSRPDVSNALARIGQHAAAPTRLSRRMLDTSSSSPPLMIWWRNSGISDFV